MLSIILFMFDLFGPYSKKEPSPIMDIFFAILSFIGIGWLSWLMYDIQKYIKMMKEFSQNSSLELQVGEDGEYTISIPVETSENTFTKLPEYYCFSTGRHSGSFFLKCGAAVFCLGNIISYVIVIAKQFKYLTDPLSKSAIKYY